MILRFCAILGHKLKLLVESYFHKKRLTIHSTFFCVLSVRFACWAFPVPTQGEPLWCESFIPARMSHLFTTPRCSHKRSQASSAPRFHEKALSNFSPCCFTRHFSAKAV